MEQGSIWDAFDTIERKAVDRLVDSASAYELREMCRAALLQEAQTRRCAAELRATLLATRFVIQANKESGEPFTDEFLAHIQELARRELPLHSGALRQEK